MGRIVNCLSNPSSLVRSHGRKKKRGQSHTLSFILFYSPICGAGGEMGREKLGIRGFFSSSKAQAHNLMSKKKFFCPIGNIILAQEPIKVILKLFISLKTNNNNQKIPNKQKSRHDGRNIRVSVIQGDRSIYSNCCGQTKQIPWHTRATRPTPPPARPPQLCPPLPMPTPTDTLENNSTQAH